MPSPGGGIDGEFFFFVKIGIIPSNSPYFLKNKNFYSGWNSPSQPKMFKFPTPDKDDGQITAGCPGGNVEAPN